MYSIIFSIGILHPHCLSSISHPEQRRTYGTGRYGGSHFMCVCELIFHNNPTGNRWWDYYISVLLLLIVTAALYQDPKTMPFLILWPNRHSLSLSSPPFRSSPVILGISSAIYSLELAPLWTLPPDSTLPTKKSGNHLRDKDALSKNYLSGC